ncbi:MAG TPA: MlaD family protein [Solirubrobacteraceae bacterium]|jgi:phospholipid/cholesterol/gamma-HCH transport system substrate-binding protein
MENDEKEGTSWVGRIAAVAALLLAVAVAAWLLMFEDEGYKVHVRFQAATNVVKGNLVQVAGRRVGTIEDIELTEDGQADLTLKIEDEDIVPLRTGTRATLRIASLSGSANRYVDLSIPPAGGQEIDEGGVIDASSTTSAVEVDQLFQMFDERTRKGLRSFIRGQARQWGDDQGRLANDGWNSVNPALVSASRLFRELDFDRRILEEFVVNSSKLVTDVADRRDDLSALVDQLADMLGAIAREEGNLRSAIDQLPPFMRRANTTFVELRGTLDELAPVVRESKPVTPKLRAVLAELRPFAREAVPTVRGLSRLVRQDGPDNDLIDLAKSVPPLRDVATRPVFRNGKERPGGFDTAVESLQGQTPHIAYFRPYTVDFTGWLDDFSHSGIYDANGSASRVATSVNAFAAIGAQLKLVPEELRQEITNAVTRTGQSNRCPGGSERPWSDGSNPWKPSPDFNCDETQIPPGR